MRDGIPDNSLRRRTGMRDYLEFILHRKWNCVGHVTRMCDGPWTTKIVEWGPTHEAYESRG